MLITPPLARPEAARSTCTGVTASDWPNDIAPTLAPSYSSRLFTRPFVSPGKSTPVMVPKQKRLMLAANFLAPIFLPMSTMPVFEERRRISRASMSMAAPRWSESRTLSSPAFTTAGTLKTVSVVITPSSRAPPTTKVLKTEPGS